MAFRTLLAAAGAAAGLHIASAAVCTVTGSPVNVSCYGSGRPRSAKDMLRDILSAQPDPYDRTARPACSNDTHRSPTIVDVQIYLTQLNKIDQKLGHVTLNGYLRTWWKDERLAFSDKANGGCVDVLNMVGDEAAGIWRPDIYIDNLVERKKDGFASLTQVSPDGSVWRSEQVLLTVAAKMELGRLPYDKQVAKVVVASYSQTIDHIRVRARGGIIGSGVSGVGVVAPRLSSAVWAFPTDFMEEAEAELGFTTPGEVEVLFGGIWDYLTMSFEYERKPKYFIDQVIMPSVLFLLVSYIQFFVDPGAAPARATLAVIPVLIMRTMSNSVYRSLPEGSQQMWLGDFLMTSMFLCALAAMQFGFIQYMMILEKNRTAKQEGLKKAHEIAGKLWTISRKEKVTLFQLLKKYTPHEKQDNDKKVMVSSAEATSQNIKEADMAFINYAHKVFSTFDNDNSNTLKISEVRKAFHFFNIYMSERQTAMVTAMYMRDQGECTPLNEMDIKLTFSRFAFLIMAAHKYTLVRSKTKNFFFRIRNSCQRMSPSKFCDVIFRFAFPMLILLQLVVFYSCLHLY